MQRAVGEGGVFAYLAACISGDAATGVGEVDELRELAIGHAGLRGFVGSLVDREGDVVGELHEGELGGGLDTAAAEGDGGSADCGESGAGVGDAVCEDELRALFDADFAGRDAGFLEGFGEKLVGVFVFVPCVDASGRGGGERGGPGFHALANTAFFEHGADDKGITFRREGPGEEALGLSPTEPGEVVEGGAGGDDEGVDFILVHEDAGAVEALLALGEGDGDGLVAAVGEGGDGGWEFVCLVRLGGE